MWTNAAKVQVTYIISISKVNFTFKVCMALRIRSPTIACVALGIKVRIIVLALHITFSTSLVSYLHPTHSVFQQHWPSSSSWMHPIPPALEMHLCCFLFPEAIFPFYCVLTSLLKHHFLRLGQFHGQLHQACIRKVCPWFYVLVSQSWNLFEWGASCFHFALDPTANSVLRGAFFELPQYSLYKLE